jgi:hypothetical protein
MGDPEDDDEEEEEEKKKREEDGDEEDNDGEDVEEPWKVNGGPNLDLGSDQLGWKRADLLQHVR